MFVITVRFLNMMKVFIRADDAEGHMTTTLQRTLPVRVVRPLAPGAEMEKFDEKEQDLRDLTMKIVRLMATSGQAPTFMHAAALLSPLSGHTGWLKTR